MNKLFVIAATVFASSVFAQSVELVRTEDGDVWYGYPSTLRQDSNRIQLQVGYKKRGTQKENMMFVSISSDTCITRSGELYSRLTYHSDWQKMANVTIPNVQSVADHIALILCSITAQQKTQKAKLIV